MMDTRKKLIKLLQKAYSGERAAALAYDGHWKSLSDENEIRIVRRIEQEEWLHRRQLKLMLDQLNAHPLFFREIAFYLVGRLIGMICRFCGRFCSAFFAGVLEGRNVQEYSIALKYAEELELDSFYKALGEMEFAEAEHEFVLREMIKDNWFFPVFASVFRWGKSADFLYQKQNARF